MTAGIQVHSFSLVVDGFHEPTAEIEDALFEHHCDDALLTFLGPTAVLAFDRASDALELAVFSAIRDVEGAGIGARVTRVTPDDLVTAADIARRIGRSRENIRLWIAGQRRDGDFPPPVAVLDQSKLWSWRHVAVWLAERKLVSTDEVQRARFLAAMNLALQARCEPELAQETDSLVAKLSNGLKRRPKHAARR